MSQNQIILNIFQTKFTTHLCLKNGAFSIASTLNDILIKLVMQARDPGEQCAGTTSLLTCESQWCIFLPIPNRWHHADMLKFALMGIFIPWKLANRTISTLTIFIFYFSFLSGSQFISTSPGGIHHDSYSPFPIHLKYFRVL